MSPCSFFFFYLWNKNRHGPANRKRFHNVFVWLYRGFVATQLCVNVFITFSIRRGKVVLEPTTGKRCRNVWFPTLPKHACITCCPTKVFGFIATFYKLKLLSLYDRSSDNVYKTFCYNIYNVTLTTQFRIPISVGIFWQNYAMFNVTIFPRLLRINVLSFTTNLLEISKPFIRYFSLSSFFYLVFPRTKKSEAHGKRNPT